MKKLKKKALRKNIRQEILQSLGRFISIFSLIALGVFAYVGLNVTGADMRATSAEYINTYNLADIVVQSTFGLDEKDRQILDNVNGIERIEYGYAKDTIVKESQKTIHVLSLPEQISTFEVVEGRLPEKSGEIILDSLLSKVHTVGDIVHFVTDTGAADEENLKETTYKVVGFANSPEYLTVILRGQSQVGSGETAGFASIVADDFDMDINAYAKMTLSETATLEPYSKKYDETVASMIQKIEEAMKGRPAAKLATVKAEAETEIRDAEQKISDGRAALAENKQKLIDAEIAIEDGAAQLITSRADFYQQIAENEAKLISAEDELRSARAQLDAAQALFAENDALLRTSEEQFAAGVAAIEAARAEVSAGEVQLRAKEAELDMAQEQVTTGLNAIGVAEGELETAQAELDAEIALGGLTPELQQRQAVLNETKRQLQEQRVELEQKQEQIAAGRVEIATQWSILEQTTVKINQEAEILNQSRQPLLEARQVLEAARSEIAANEASYEKGVQDTATGWQLLETGRTEGLSQLQVAEQTLSDARIELESGRTIFETERVKAERELADAEQEVNDARADLAKLKEPKYTVQSRSGFLGFDQYVQNSERIDVLSYIFPVFFFFIAALVALTTMTRMVEEQRTQIGTLKALGYSNHDIMLKYVVYGTVSGVFGAIIGNLIGMVILPGAIFGAYQSSYIFQNLKIGFYWEYALISMIIAIGCTTIPAITSVRSELKEKATDLMRPKAPKNGQRILLERLTFIWKRMSFNYKVTARNLFRYKQRMLMTIFGVAGCTALLITGFGIRDSLAATITIQYNELTKYSLLSIFDGEASEGKLADYRETLVQNETEVTSLTALYKTVKTAIPGEKSQDVNLITPKQPERMNDFILLRERQSQAELNLADDGVIITEKLAILYNLSVGDTLTIKDDDLGEYTVNIAGINQWYIEHYMFMSPTYYQKIFEQNPKFNSDLIRRQQQDSTFDLEAFAKKIVEKEGVLTVVQLQSATNMVEETLGGLNTVIAMLIFSAGMLAMIVLYNLTNINVSERIRELSTIKVLGFYPKEVTLYIYRETFILTGLGVLAGCIMGTILEQFIMGTLPPDMMFFDLSIRWRNYLYSSLITIFISIVVMFIMHRKLKRVDMIEALKSVE